jgi:hypothetical protein
MSGSLIDISLIISQVHENVTGYTGTYTNSSWAEVRNRKLYMDMIQTQDSAQSAIQSSPTTEKTTPEEEEKPEYNLYVFNEF